MNPFLLLVIVICVVSWIICAVGLLATPVVYRRLAGEWDPWFLGRGTLVLSGIVMLLLAAAVFTGGFSFDARRDGCYYIHTEGSGKTVHSVYDPIACPFVPPKG